MRNTHREYTVAEELVHAVTHGAGVILSIVGLAWMLHISIGASDPWRIVASCVYGASLIAMFLASTLYHAWPDSPRKQSLKLFDHCAIYLLIAGTYTPFLIVAMRTDTGWFLFGAIWSLATAGILTKIWLRHRYSGVSLVGYLVMGWLVVVAAPQVADAIGTSGTAWLVAGGVSYTAGTLFYMTKRLPYNHVIWHLFVLVGGVCHFLAVVRYVLPTVQTAATIS